MKTREELLDQIDTLQRKLINNKVDLSIKDARILELETQLREARFEVRELEIGTHTLRTLALEAEEESFDPRATGTFDSDVWRKAR